jgi:drug efflux transport system permease protein
VREILSFMRKEFLQLRRDRRMIPILFISPIVQLLLLGFAVDLDVRDVPSVVCDLDRTAASRDFLAAYFHSGYFTEKGRAETPGEVDRFLDDGLASMAFVIPRGFGDDLAAGRTARVQLIVDGSESQSATVGLNYASLIAARVSQGILVEAFEKAPAAGLRPVRLAAEVRVWYNPELRSRYFLVPGILGLILMVMTMMVTSMAIVREKEMGTLEQLIVTPLRSREIILGKLLPFVAIGLIDVTLVVSVATWLIGVPLRGSLPLLLGLSLVFMLTTLGLGLFVSTISRNQQQAMLTAVFFIIPMMLLGGFVFPIENMPRFFQAVAYAIPIRYYFTIIRGIFLKGVGLPELWDEAAAMLAFGLGIFTLSVLRFRKKLE